MNVLVKANRVIVAILSERIQSLQAHFQKNTKDIHSRRGLMALMQRRRRLLMYLESKDPETFVRVVDKYGIREGTGATRVTSRPETWSPPRAKEDVLFRPKTWQEFKQGSSNVAAGKDR